MILGGERVLAGPAWVSRFAARDQPTRLKRWVVSRYLLSSDDTLIYRSLLVSVSVAAMGIELFGLAVVVGCLLKVLFDDLISSPKPMKRIDL